MSNPRERKYASRSLILKKRIFPTWTGFGNPLRGDSDQLRMVWDGTPRIAARSVDRTKPAGEVRPDGEVRFDGDVAVSGDIWFGVGLKLGLIPE